MKKMISAFLALLSIFSLTACGGEELPPVNVIIIVNGQPIYRQEYEEIRDYYYDLYFSYSGDAKTAQEYVDQQQENILQSLVQRELIRQKAEEKGYLNYTDEDRQTAQEQAAQEKKEYVDSLFEDYKAALSGQTLTGKKEGESEDDYFRRIAEEKYLMDLQDNGKTEEKIVEEIMLENAVGRFREDELKGVTMSEDEIMAEYDRMVQEQKAALMTDEDFVEAYNAGTYQPLVAYRPGYSLVAHILIAFDSATQNTLQGYATTISEYDEEIADYEAQLAEEETDELKDKLEKAKAEQAEFKEKYEALLEESLPGIREKTDTVCGLVKDADEDTFLRVMAEYTEDPGMQDEEAGRKGYLTGPADGMVSEFSAAARALEEGQTSEPVATAFGYHILRCLKKLPESEMAYDAVKDELRESLLSDARTDAWTEKLTQWQAEAVIITYSERL